MVNKKVFSAVLVTAMILSIVGGASVAFAQTQTATPTVKSTQTIAQIAANNTNLTKFVSLLKIANLTGANLTNVLNGPGNFTVFAPTNAAFAKVDASTLASWQNNTTALGNILSYHIVPLKYLSSNFTDSGTVPTLNGLRLPYSVNGTTLKVDDATVTTKDINASNGVIHIIDSVMVPPTTGAATASATASGGFLGLPGFEAFYAVAGLLAVAYLVIRRRK